MASEKTVKKIKMITEKNKNIKGEKMLEILYCSTKFGFGFFYYIELSIINTSDLQIFIKNIYFGVSEDKIILMVDKKMGEHLEYPIRLGSGERVKLYIRLDKNLKKEFDIFKENYKEGRIYLSTTDGIVKEFEGTFILEDIYHRINENQIIANTPFGHYKPKI